MWEGQWGIGKGRCTGKSLGAAVAEPAAKAGVVPNETKGKNRKGGSYASASATDYEIDNDASLELLARTSVSLTRARIDIIPPSHLVDGRVPALRPPLDAASF